MTAGAAGAAGAAAPRVAGTARTFNLDGLYQSGLTSAPTPAAHVATAALKKALPSAEIVAGAAADLKMAIGLQAEVTRVGRELVDAKKRAHAQNDRVLAAEQQLERTHGALISERVRSAELVQTMEARVSEALAAEGAVRARLDAAKAEATKATALSAARLADATRRHEAAQEAATLQASASAEAVATAELELKKGLEAMKVERTAHASAVGTYQSRVAELQASLDGECRLRCAAEADRDAAHARLAELAAGAEAGAEAGTEAEAPAIGCAACQARRRFGISNADHPIIVAAEEAAEEATKEAATEATKEVAKEGAEEATKEAATETATKPVGGSSPVDGAAALSVVVKRAQLDAEEGWHKVDELQERLNAARAEAVAAREAVRQAAAPRLVVDFPLTECTRIDSKIHPAAHRSAGAGVCGAALGTRFASGVTGVSYVPCTGATVGTLAPASAATTEDPSLVSCVLDDIKSFLMVAQTELEE